MKILYKFVKKKKKCLNSSENVRFPFMQFTKKRKNIYIYILIILITYRVLNLNILCISKINIYFSQIIKIILTINYFKCYNLCTYYCLNKWKYVFYMSLSVIKFSVCESYKNFVLTSCVCAYST